MNKTTSFQIGEHLWVVTEPLQKTTAPPATSVDHVFVIDCSGSMSARAHRGRLYTRLKRLVVLVSYAIYRKRCLTMQGGSSKPCLVGSRRH